MPATIQEPNIQDTRPVFKILSVDGGGFRGLSTAAALHVIEEHNKPLTHHFDLLCGTSTGGLIVLALAAGKSAKCIVEFYRKSGPLIFPPLGFFKTLSHKLRIATSEHKHKYPNTVLKKTTEEILEGKRIGDANSFLCVPALNMTTFSPRVFKTDHDPTLTRDSKIALSDVALATAAAPTFFPITSCIESNEPQYYADGGLWANNPTLIGVTEALRFFAGPGKPYRSIRVLSLGCSSGVSGRMAGGTYAKWGHQFVSEMVEAAGEAQQKATQHYVSFLRQAFCIEAEVERITLAPLSTAQAQAIALDVATKQAIETLIQLGIDTGHQYKAREEITSFFEQTAPKIKPKPVF